MRSALLAVALCALLALGAHGSPNTNVHLLPAPFNTTSLDGFFTSLAMNWAEQIKAGRDVEIPLVAREALLTASPFVDTFKFEHVHGSEDECDDCKAEARRLQSVWFSEAVRERLMDGAVRICLDYDLFADYICEGAVEIFADLVIEIVGHSALEPLEVCARRGICTVEADPTWSAEFPVAKPPVRIPVLPAPEAQRKYVLHITDLHYDPKYTVGLEAECGDPLCCRPPNPVATVRAAGYFGDYKCDAPLSLIVSMFDYITTNSSIPSVDYIVWTGDIPPHDVWESTRDGYIDLMREMADLVHAYFPNATVIPAIGNHESVPVDEFAPVSFTDERFSISWLYQALADQWSYWLPESAQAQMQQGGSFSFLLEPEVRAISVNDEGCSGNNWWLRMRTEGGCCVQEFPDPDNILHWLIQELQAAEDNRERVLLVRHVPNRSRCNNAWSVNYDKIVTRYENVIAGVFSGHTHDDHYYIHYADFDTRNVASVLNFVAPAGTPYTNGNPAFNVYEFAWDTVDLVDWETHTMDLTLANQRLVADWFREYTATEAYGFDAAFPQAMHEFVERMEQDDALFQLWFKHYHKSYLNGRTCDAVCKASMLCDIRTAIAGEGCPTKLAA